MKFQVLTLFPELFKNFMEESIIGRALRDNKVEINFVNIRDFGIGRHKKVDDTVFGGGGGMLGNCEAIFGAFESLHEEANYQFSIFNFQKEKNIRQKRKIRHVYLTPQGKKFTQR